MKRLLHCNIDVGRSKNASPPSPSILDSCGTIRKWVIESQVESAMEAFLWSSIESYGIDFGKEDA